MSRKTVKSLRCYARPSRRGVWVAKCVDLDVATQADSLEAARLSLDEAVVGYLTTIMNDCTPEEARVLLNRKSPLWERILWEVLYRGAVLNHHVGRMTAFLREWPSLHHDGPATTAC